MKTYYRGLYKSVSRLGASKSQCHGISPVTCRNKWTLFQHVLADTNLQLSCEIFASHICLSPGNQEACEMCSPNPSALSLEVFCPRVSDAAREGTYYLPHVVLNTRKFKEAVL